MLSDAALRVRDRVDFELWRADLFLAFHRGEMRGENVVAIVDELTALAMHTSDDELRCEVVNLLRDVLLAGYPGLKCSSGVG